MRKAIMTNKSNDEIVNMSEFSIEVIHKGGNKVNLTTNNYTYEDVFEYIKEHYEEDLDRIQKVTIEVVR